MKAPSRVDIILGLGVVVLSATIAVLVMAKFEPIPLRFMALEIVNSPVVQGETLNVIAETKRLSSDGCTNGVQVDARDLNGGLLRMPVPAREMLDSVSRYSIVIPETAPTGRYQLRVRETFNCGGPPKIIDAPWLPFEIAPAVVTDGD